MGRNFQSLRQNGIVLPIVLVVMMVVTMLVVTQVRRGTVDERLAANWSRAISGQTAAESLVRYCEAELFRTQAGIPYKAARDWKLSPNTARSENFQATAAWASNLAANQYITIQPDLLPPGATAAICVVEDATNELLGGRHQGGPNPGTTGINDPYLWKFRLTVVVTFTDSTAFGNVIYRAQSEVRFLVT